MVRARVVERPDSRPDGDLVMPVAGVHFSFAVVGGEQTLVGRVDADTDSGVSVSAARVGDLGDPAQERRVVAVTAGQP